MKLTRREMLRRVAGSVGGAAALAALPGGCASTSWSLRPEERSLLAGVGEVLEIPPVGVPEAEILRQWAREIDVGADLSELERRMRATLEDSGGVGLAAPQVGISVRAVLVTLGVRDGDERTVWCVNPIIERRSPGLQDDMEGCLSVADVCGLVRRNLGLTVSYFDGRGPAELEVEGFDARIFQHEIDHLDGVLFTDRLVGAPAPQDALRPLRTELAARREAGRVGDVLAPEQVAELWRDVLEGLAADDVEGEDA